MTVHLRHRDKPCAWVEPRPHSDASLRFMKHGKVLPMESDLPRSYGEIFRRALARRFRLLGRRK